MLKWVLPFLVFSFFLSSLFAQDIQEKKDTFFLAKKKGLLGKLGKSLATDPPNQQPVKVVNPLIIHTGQIIRNIEILRLGFERNINDTTRIKNSFGVIVANGFHKKTTINVIRNNLFFKTGDRVNPYLLADNERYLRSQVYIQDARILIDNVAGSSDSVDVIVITKDVFSIGGSLNIHNASEVSTVIRNENLAGSGSRLSVSALYDAERNPKFGYGAEFLKRNIKGTFIDGSVGIQTFRSAFNSGRYEETYLYTHLEKPLVTPYIPWIGAFDLSVNRTNNDYLTDSLYNSDFKYNYRTVDGWFGYNFGSQRLLYKNMQTRIRKFVAIRGVHQHFSDIPLKNHQLYDYRYANVAAVLAAFNIFKQDAYRANFIYGFGRNEDIPEGFSAAVIAGWTRKENKDRPYYGVQGQRSHFSEKGFYTTYTFRMGGYMYKNRSEDIDILLNIDHFTKLRKLSKMWYNRNFLSAGFTKQIRPVLNEPLMVNSDFGLPFFGYPGPSDVRTTLKLETVFFNMQKFYGFRLAPFLFADLSMLRPTNQPFTQSTVYSDLGAGVRTRNENLTFGTVELRGYYFPKTLPGMKNYRIEIGTNIRFKYNNTFVQKPDFIVPN